MSFLALTDAHFRLAGGWRQNLAILIGYLGLVVFTATLFYRTAGPSDFGQVSGALLGIVTGVQGLMLLLVAPGAIRNAVKRDFDTGMMESHRLTPLTGLSLVLGYLTGPTAQALMMYGMGLLVGGYFAGSYGQSIGFVGASVGGWYFSQLCLLPLALLIAALVLLTAVATRGKANLLAILVLGGVFSGWLVVHLVPGVALLMGVMSAGLLGKLVGLGAIGGSDPAVLGWAMLLQVAVALPLYAAACRKVRYPHRPAFSLFLGLALLAATAVCLATGMYYLGDYNQWTGWERQPQWQTLGSVLTFMLVALLPLVAAATKSSAPVAERARRVGTLVCHAVPALLALSTAGLLLVIVWTPDASVVSAECWPLVLVALLLSFHTDFAVIRLAQRTGLSVFVALLVDWIVLKILPVVVTSAAAIAQELLGREVVVAGWLGGLSPLGTLLDALRFTPTWPGLGFQGVVLVVLAVAALRLRRPLAVSDRRG